jgi:hypothetical protein
MQAEAARRLLPIGVALVMALSVTVPPACALQVSSQVHPSELPDAPAPAISQVSGSQGQSAVPGPANAQLSAGTATVSGTVMDSSQDVIQGAKVILSGPGEMQRSTISGSSGQFAFTGLPAGAYTLKVSGPGMSTYQSKAIVLQAGDAKLVPPVTLSIAGTTTSVTVTGDKEQLAEEQVQIAVQQRVLGVIPNFYSSYDRNAPPMMAKQKYKLIGRSLIDPVFFLEVAGIAGAEQYQGVFPAYGCCFEGYAKRYGAAFANQLAGDMLGRAVYPAIFHQDPRYFYKGKGGARSRALYAMSQAVVARSDSGRMMPNYSQIFGNLSAGAISNLYYPEADRGAKLVFLNALATTGANAVGNLIREFILKDLTTRAKGSRQP